MNWLLARLREPSTWRGIVWLLTAFGVTLDPMAWEYIMAIGMALAGLLGVLTQEHPASPSAPPPAGFNDQTSVSRESHVADATVSPPPIQGVGCATAGSAVRAEADDRRVVGAGADLRRPATDRLRESVPTRSNFGVRPPIERPLDDQFSGGWGDR